MTRSRRIRSRKASGLGATILWGRPYEGVRPTRGVVRPRRLPVAGVGLELAAAVLLLLLVGAAVLSRAVRRPPRPRAPCAWAPQAGLPAALIASVTFPALRDARDHRGHGRHGRPLRMRVCLIRQGFYPLDTRVRREVAALAAAGHAGRRGVRPAPGAAAARAARQVTVHRLPLPVRRAEGRVGYVLRYAGFALRGGFRPPRCRGAGAGRSSQANSMPTRWCSRRPSRACSARAWCSTCTSACPEFFSVKFGVPVRHPVARLLVAAEQVSIRFADRAITCTEQMRAAFVARGARPEKLDGRPELERRGRLRRGAVHTSLGERRDGRFTSSATARSSQLRARHAGSRRRAAARRAAGPARRGSARRHVPATSSVSRPASSASTGRCG